MIEKNCEPLPSNKQSSPDKQPPRHRKRKEAIATIAIISMIGGCGFYSGTSDNDPLPTCSDIMTTATDFGGDKPTSEHVRTLEDLSFLSKNEAWEYGFRGSGIDVQGYSEGAPATTAVKVKITDDETKALYSGVITYSANDREQGKPIILTIANTADLKYITPSGTGIITINSHESAFHPNGGCTTPLPGQPDKHLVALTLAEKNQNHAYRRTSGQMDPKARNGIITTINQNENNFPENPFIAVNYGNINNEHAIGLPAVSSGYVIGYNPAEHTKTLLTSSESLDDSKGQGGPLFFQPDPNNPYTFQIGGLMLNEVDVKTPSSAELEKYNLSVTDADIQDNNLRLVTVLDSSTLTEIVTNSDVKEKAVNYDRAQSAAAASSGATYALT